MDRARYDVYLGSALIRILDCRVEDAIQVLMFDMIKVDQGDSTEAEAGRLLCDNRESSRVPWRPFRLSQAAMA